MVFTDLICEFFDRHEHLITSNLLVNSGVKKAPHKQAAFPQYKYPQASARFKRIADLMMGGTANEEKVDLLIAEVQELKGKLDIPLSIKDAGVSEAAFMAKIDELAELAFDDQCTGANPQISLISEIKELYIKVDYGEF
jgi:acetaldehyde dehydrogenase/alcohol dehydrogenase